MFIFKQSELEIVFMNDCVVTNILVYGYDHTGKFIRRFAGIYPYYPYFIDRKW